MSSKTKIGGTDASPIFILLETNFCVSKFAYKNY